MVQMEEGTINDKENDTEKVNFMGAVAICSKNVDVNIPDEEVQPEVIIPEIHMLQDQSSESNEDNSTSPDSKNICQQIISDIIEDIITQEDNSETFCQCILLDILENIEKGPPSLDHEVGIDNQILHGNQNPDEILLIHVEEIIVQKNILQDGEY